MNARLPIACVVALASGCGGLLIINQPDGGKPCCDGGLPDGGPTDNGPPDMSQSTLVVLPDTTGVADGQTPVTIRVIVRDAAGHLLNGVGVAMSCDGSSNAFNPRSGAGYTGTDGTFQAGLTSTLAEPKTVSVAVGTVNTFTLTAQLDFVAGQPHPSNSSLALTPAPPGTVLADGAQVATITATLADVYSNIVTNYTVAFTATGSNNTFDPAGTANTDAAGVARIRLKSTRAESKTVVATVSNLFVMTRPVTFSAGAASQASSSLTAAPTSLVAGGTSFLTLVARDASGNAVGSLPINFSATGSGNTFTPGPSVSTNVDGVARVDFSSTVAEPKTINAQAAGLNLTTSVLFGPGSPTNGNSTLEVDTPVVANGTASGLVTATIRDPGGNPILGVSVALDATGSLNTFTPASSGSTNASGVFTARLSSTVAEQKAVTAVVSGPPAFTLTNFMDFLPGPPNLGTSTLSASPESLPADGVATTTLEVTIRDVNGNPIPGLNVTLSSTGSQNTFSKTTGTTAADGTFAATLRSPKAELKTVTATAGGISLQTSVSFLAGPPSAATSSVTALPSGVVADNLDTTTITATIRDALGNGVPNVQVTLSATGSRNWFDPYIPVGYTGAAGVFTARLSSYTAETKTITATAASVAPTTTVTFVPANPYSSTCILTINPLQVVANGTDYATVSFLVRDPYDNVIPNYPVSLYTYNVDDVFRPSSSGYTNASGVFTARMSSTVAEQKTVYANANGLASGQAPVAFVPP